MIKKLQHIGFLKLQRFAAVEAVLSGEEPSFHFVLMRRKKGTVYIEDSGEELDADTLGTRIPAGTAVSLCFSGSKVLLKEVEFDRSGNLLSSALPQAGKDEIAVETVCGTEDKGWVFMTRKESVKTEITKLVKAGLQICDWTLGIPHIEDMHGAMDGNEIITHSYAVRWNEEGIVSMARTGNNDPGELAEVMGEKLPPALVLPFLSAIRYFYTNRYSREDEAGEEVLRLREEYLFSLFFKKSVKVVLPLLLLVLLLNFGFFSHYSSLRDELSEQVGELRIQTGALEKQKGEQVRKRELLGENFRLESSFSLFADDLAKELPAGMQLMSLRINPPAKKLKAGRPAEFDNGLLYVEGKTRDHPRFKKWLDAIRGREWVSRIVITHYGESEKTQPAEFELKIHY